MMRDNELYAGKEPLTWMYVPTVKILDGYIKGLRDKLQTRQRIGL
jgi:hypothetical protein